MRQLLFAAVMVCICHFCCSEPGDQTADNSAVESFTGSQSCRPCHERFYQLWAPSHHGLAMQPFTAEFSRSQLTSQSEDLVIGDRRYRAEITPGDGFIVENNNGSEIRYPIEFALGGKNVFYFLTPVERGRLQVLPIGYDVRRKEWFNTTASMVRHFADLNDEAIDWRERALTFNTSCYNCHVSQLSTNYDLQTDTYRTTWAEPGINCETCHGPCAEHIEVCSAMPEGQVPDDLKIIQTKLFSIEQTNALCAPCHARMMPLTASARPGGPFFDQYDLVALENPDFYPDGRDLGENFTYTLWRMSPCAKSGQLDCLHCHTSSGRYRFMDDNANSACLPCHEANVKNAAGHSKHPANSEGSKCVSCHMPKTEFARMVRSDHSMRPPAPAATIAYQSPNACNLCHDDQSAEWADAWVRKWRKRDHQKPILYRAGLVAAARKGDWQRLPEMLSCIAEGDEEMVITSLIRLLVNCEDDSKWPVLIRALRNPSPLVRSAAAEGLQYDHTPVARDALLAAIGDDIRVVRLRAAMALTRFPPDLVGEGHRNELRRAFQEYKTSLEIRQDDWSSHYNLGNFYFNLGDLQQALASFETASKLHPGSIVPLVNMALVYNLTGRNAAAEQSLRNALAIDPENAAANLNLGLLMAEQGRLREAEDALRTTLQSDPKSAVAAYNLGVLVSQASIGEAIEFCSRAYALRPQEPRYGYTYGFYLNQVGNKDKAIEVLRQTSKRHPTHAESLLLLGMIYEEQGDAENAEAVYRKALTNEQIPEHDRFRIGARLQAIR